MVVTTKSASITSWDSTPIVEVTTGEGAPGFLKSVNDTITQVVAGSNIGDLVRYVRIPTNAKIKQVLFTVTTVATAGAQDLDVAFSDSTVDGTNQGLAGGVVQLTGPADNKLFGSGVLLTGLLQNKDQTFLGTAFPFLPSMCNLPLWQALVNLGATQFTADPGGYFDIIGKTTAAPTVTAPVSAIQVNYVEGP